MRTLTSPDILPPGYTGIVVMPWSGYYAAVNGHIVERCDSREEAEAVVNERTGRSGQDSEAATQETR